MPQSPILIVGGGLAGLFCALKLAPRKAVVLATAPLGEGASSVWAQGGVAAAMSEGDTPEKHARDTMAAAAGIANEAIVLGMTREAGDRVRDLLAYGAPFDRDSTGGLLQSREAAHSERRIARVRGDAAGQAIMAALIAAVRAAPSIEVLDGWEAERLLMSEGRVVGVAARGPDGIRRSFRSEATVLATGGAGHIYAVTTNPPQARGMGLAMAAEAGAVVADAEFVQFHPTAIDIGRDPAPLATEALRGDGATLINRAGERFMRAAHPDAELAPRDIVARAVFAELAAGRGAFLDCRAAIGAEFAARFPTVYAICASAGIDPATTPIPVAPAAHYFMGGVWTDARGRGSLPGLWAIGEVASTGVHGANRLASNSLLEAVVFGARAAWDIRDGSGHLAEPPWGESEGSAENARDSADDTEPDAPLIARLRATMSAHVGVVRDAEGLTRALREIGEMERSARSRTTRAMATAGLLVAACALQRRESRGGHFRSDYPLTDAGQAQRSLVTLAHAKRVAAEA